MLIHKSPVQVGQTTPFRKYHWNRKALTSRSFIAIIIMHVLLRQLHLEAFLLLIPCVYILEETDLKLNLQ